MQVIEKTYKNEGLLVTLVFHALLLGLFYFFMLSSPNPPLEDYKAEMGGGGVDLNYGDDPNVGMGDNSNLLPVETATQEELNKELNPSETPEPTTTEDVTEATTTPTELEDAVEIDAKDSKDKKVEAKKTENVEAKKVEEKPVETKYKFPGKTSASTSSASTSGGQNNNTPGNPGVKNGQSESGTRLFGTPGSGGGKNGIEGNGDGPYFGDGFGNLKFVGNPKPVDNSNEFGRIKFLLTVDEDGQILNVEVGENFGISPSVQRLYMNHIKTLSVEAPDGVDINPRKKIPVWYTIKSK